MISYVLEKREARERIKRLESVIIKCRTMRQNSETVSSDLNSLAGVVAIEIKLRGIEALQRALRNLSIDLADSINVVEQASKSRIASLEKQICYWTDLEREFSSGNS